MLPDRSWHTLAQSQCALRVQSLWTRGAARVSACLLLCSLVLGLSSCEHGGPHPEPPFAGVTRPQDDQAAGGGAPGTAGPATPPETNAGSAGAGSTAQPPRAPEVPGGEDCPQASDAGAADAGTADAAVGDPWSEADAGVDECDQERRE
jgi:hypothetical protein